MAFAYRERVDFLYGWPDFFIEKTLDFHFLLSNKKERRLQIFSEGGAPLYCSGMGIAMVLFAIRL